MKLHWTAKSIKDYIFRIAADFIAQLEIRMDSTENYSQDKLAKDLGISKGRVSQVLNHPGNMTLRNIVRYAKALGMKVSLVAYDDDDPKNENGPINPEIFRVCWEKLGKPRDMWTLDEMAKTLCVTTVNIHLQANLIFYDLKGGMVSDYSQTAVPPIGKIFRREELVLN